MGLEFTPGAYNILNNYSRYDVSTSKDAKNRLWDSRLRIHIKIVNLAEDLSGQELPLLTRLPIIYPVLPKQDKMMSSPGHMNLLNVPSMARPAFMSTQLSKRRSSSKWSSTWLLGIIGSSVSVM
jgi:hypothetical protein